jgi:RNA polymerase sigma-70 factor (ECF subfamily)
MTDPSPAAALRESRDDARRFEDFYCAHAGPMLRWFARHVLDPELAMDLTAETFAQAFAGRTRFRGHSDGEAAAWLYRIAERQLTRTWRRGRSEQRAVRRLGIETPKLSPDEFARLHDLAELAGRRASVAQGLSRLPRAQRDAVHLRVIDELTYSEVAQQLRISEDTARARVSRGLRALARALIGPPTEEAR